MTRPCGQEGRRPPCRTTPVDTAADRVLLLNHPGPTAGPPLVVCPPLAGTVYCYGELARLLGPQLAVHGVQAVGLGGRREPLEWVEAMACCHADAVAALVGDGPVVLCGWSFGGVLALETALQLRSRGTEVALLVIVDTLALVGHQPRPGDGARSFVRELERARGVQLRITRAQLEHTPTAAQAALVERQARAAGVALGTPDELQKLLRVYKASTRALRRYMLKQQHLPHQGPVLALFCGAPGAVEDRGWGARTTGRLQLERVPGGHHEVLEPPHVQAVAEQIRRAVQQLNGTARSV